MSADSRIAAPPISARATTPRSMYRLRSETSDATGELWDLRWEALPPSNEPAILRTTSRERFQQLDATGLLDSDVRISAAAIATLLGE